MATDETTNLILDAAERLFAQKGYEASSIRQITKLADVNVAAVHYHFGDKQAVLRAVTDRIVGPMVQRRTQMLDLAQAAAAPEPPPMTAVAEAFIRPDIETLQELQRRGPTTARFVGQIYSDQTPWIQAMALEQFLPLRPRFLAAIAAANPELDDDEIAWRLSQVVTLLIGAFRSWPTSGRSSEEAEALIAGLTDFAAAGLSRPPVLTDPTTHHPNPHHQETDHEQP